MIMHPTHGKSKNRFVVPSPSEPSGLVSGATGGGYLFMRKKKTLEEKKQSARETRAKYEARPEIRENNIESRVKWHAKPENKEKQKKAKARYRAMPGNREKDRRWKKETQRATRLEMIEEYGGRCKCCSEAEPQFLAIDHINNDGASERRRLKGPIAWLLKKQGWPKGNYQLLCYNCNWSKHVNGGECVHNKKRKALADSKSKLKGDE